MKVDSGTRVPYSALCLVQQWIHALRQPTELLKKPTHRLREGGLWYKSPVFSAMLGSTVDTCTASAYGAFEEAHTSST